MLKTIKIIFSSIWSFIKPVLLIVYRHFDKDDLFVAYQIVKRYCYSDKSSEEKREIAREELKNRLLKHGKKVSTKLLNLLIEIVYLKIETEISEE